MRARGVRAAVVGLLFVGLVSACTDDSSPGSADPGSPSLVVPDEPVEGGTLRLGVEKLRTFDPAMASPGSQSELLAADLLFDGLPALAATTVPSADLAVWTFVLRPGATFANGRPIVASDVKYSLERVVQQGVGSLAGSRLEVVKGYGDFLSGYTTELTGVVVVNESTVEISLTEPFALLSDVLSAPSFGIVARETVDALAATPVGSGPFRLMDPSAPAGDPGDPGEGDVVRLARADGATGYLDGIELHQYEELEGAYADFAAGRLDWSLVPQDRVAEAVSRFGAAAMRPFEAELFYAFNLLNPKFADVRFRQAIVKAIDRAALVRSAYPAVGLPLNGVVPVGEHGHVDDPCGAPCAFDPAGARLLLAEAFPAGGPPVPTVNLDYFSGTDEEAVAAAMEASLVAVGIPVTKRAKSDADYDQFVTSGQQELFRFGWIGAYPSADAYVTALFKSGSRDNVTGFASADVDGLLASARATSDPAARAALYQQAETAVMQQVPIVPIAQFQTRAVVSPRVQALSLGLGGTFDPTAVWLVP